jgi:hypothetical protein
MKTKAGSAILILIFKIEKNDIFLCYIFCSQIHTYNILYKMLKIPQGFLLCPFIFIQIYALKKYPKHLQGKLNI